jgi:Raf kinase inhibitor-like YbhB/YbcL family protein
MRRFLIAAMLVLGAPTAHAADFTLTSPDIDPTAPLPQRFEFDGFGCKGENRSPVLRWSGAPAGTKSFAVTVYDPDAPTGSGWWHWLVVDVPATAEGLPENAGAVDGSGLPAPAKHVRTDFGRPGFGGACPPAGDTPHRYEFTVYALKVESLGLPENATAAMAGFAMRANALGKASFTVRYGR